MDELFIWWPELLSLHLAASSLALLIYVITTHGLRMHRHPSAAIAWIALMLAAPYFALPVYLMFGLRKHRRARLLPAWPGPAEPGKDPWIRLSQGLGLPTPTAYDSLVIDADGADARTALLRLLESAEHTIDIATFTFADDALGAAVGEQLLAATRRGAKVRVLVDGLGVWLYRHGHFRRLRDAGVRIAYYSPVFDWPFRGRANLRNHRKMVVVDSVRVWLGGRNLATEYFVDAKTRAWIDFSFSLRGPIATTLTMLFERDWAFAARRRWVAPQQTLTEIPSIDDALLIPSGPEYADDTLHAMLVWACHAARERISIATPYFVPDPELLAALVCALRRGVAVQMLMPEKSNHRLADWARGRAVRDLQVTGGEVLLTPGMSHAKLILIDQTIAFAGSANIDARSLFINHELMLGLRRPADIAMMRQWFDTLAAGCTPQRMRPLTLRRDLKEGLAQWLTFQL